MNTATISSCKQTLIQRISTAQSLDEIRKAYHSTMAHYEEEASGHLPRYTLEEIRQSIDETLVEIASGEGTAHDEFKKEMQLFVESL